MDLLAAGLEIEGHDPTHGINCACMDKYIRQVRLVFDDFDANTQARLRHIILAATRL